MKTFTTINPATEEELKKYNYFQDDQIEEIINKCNRAWLNWKDTPFSQRSHLLLRMKTLLIERKETLAKEITTEMGKPLTQSVAEIEKCAWVCEYYANNAETFLQKDVVETDATSSYIRYDPLGVVLAIMPWNFPYWQVFRFAAPALMAGNGCLLKHSPNTTGCALMIQKLFEEAGFPDNLFQTILTDIPQIESIVENKKIAAVTLTGSTSAGKSLAALAGKHLKKSVLELGGSDPYLILPDADIKMAAETCVTGRLLNAGQSCIAAKRFIVFREVYDDFLKQVKTIMQDKVLDDPNREGTDIGPMARKDLLKTLNDQVIKSVKNGAKIELGGQIPDRKGYFYPPTILTNVSKGMPAYDEELFGPVASVIVVENEEQAIQIANDTQYGLGSAIFSKDITKAELLASKIEAGSTFINTFVKSDPRLPFGGIKSSGYGRELSFLGIREFVNAKTIYIN